MDISTILDDVRYSLSDEDKIRWSDRLLLGYYNDALSILMTYLPYLVSEIKIIKARAGLVQSLPKDVKGKIIAVLGQTDADGNLLNEIEFKSNEDINRWNKSIATNDCNHNYVMKSYKYDRSGKEFVVEPPIPDDGEYYIKVLYSPDISNYYVYNVDTPNASNILDPIMIPIVKEWMLYRSLNSDIHSASSIQLGINHVNQFWKLIGDIRAIQTNISPVLRGGTNG